MQKLIQKRPEVHAWLTKPYKLKEIQQTIMQLKNNKATGTDGIPGEIYKITSTHFSHFILELVNQILHGQPIPEQWTEGAIIHLRRKDMKTERNNYRPICLTQIIYKIWSKLITNKLTRIMHLATSNTQYGYKQNVSTADAIIKLEQAISTGPNTTAITLMDLSKAFDCVDRKLLWGTMYKIGIPIKMMLHIKEGHQKTTLRSKDNGKYGRPIKNNIGVFQGASLSALLFAIYLEDMMQDNQALNDLHKLPQRYAIQARPNTHT